jgi:tetratricopeptide (TPR) repeat protein
MSKPGLYRREFLGACAAGFWLAQRPLHSERVPIHYRQQPPYEQYRQFIEPGRDEFAEEKAAMELEVELKAWWQALHPASEARFYVLPDDLVRFEIKEPGKYRTGTATILFELGRVSGIALVEEYTAASESPLFRDVTGVVFEGVASFAEQLSRGIPYWTARLDSATGIDIYGNNGIAVGDIDNDGVDEVFVCQPGGLPNRLYKLIDGRLADISSRAGIDLLDSTASALFLDLRNSGLQDLVVLLTTGPVLFLNNGDGAFRVREHAFQFASPPQGTFTGMAAADYDRDGKLDLYLCSYLFFQNEAQYRYPVPYHDAQNGPPNYLFHNRLDLQGNGGFDDVTLKSGINQNDNRFSFAAAWCDYDDDGWPDLYVANDFGRKNLYKNDRGRFHDVAAEAGVEDIGPGMSATWFDYDGDGRPDIYVANMWSAAGQRVANSNEFVSKHPGLTEAYRRHTKGNSLYRNLGTGRFALTDQLQFGRWAWSSDGHDFDCDGAPEIFVTCGMLTNSDEPDAMSFFWRQVVAKSPVDAKPSAAYENGWNALNQFIREGYSWNGREPNVFFVRKQGKYRDFSGVSGLDVAQDGRAFAVTDLTGDGSLDIILKSRLGPQVRVFENRSAGDRKRIVFKLRGTNSNRDAIGAKVTVDGQVKWLAAGSGYLSQHTKLLHFGLNSRDTAERVTITWPSGIVQTFGPLNAGYCYTIIEGQSQVSKAALKARKFADRVVPVLADNKPSLASTWFIEPIPLPDNRSGPGLVTITGRESEDTLAAYSVFRRYLFEWRMDLEAPLYLLVDEKGRARRIYSRQPDASEVAADVRAVSAPLPFEGHYLVPPRRDFFKMGAALLSVGYPEPALPYLESALLREPNVRTMVLVAQIYIDAHRTKEARELLERALAADPSSPEAWNELGAAESSEGNIAAGLKCFLKALEIKPDLTYATMNAAQAYADLNDNASAENFFGRALAIDPNLADAANGLGLALAKQNRPEEAKKAFERAIELRRGFGSAINNLGVLYTSLGDLSNAIAAFTYGTQASPDDDTLYMNLTSAYVQRGDRDKARQVVHRWLDRKPGDTQALRALGALDRMK